MSQAPAASTPRPRRADRVIWLAWAALVTATMLAWLLAPRDAQTNTTVGKGLVAAVVVLAAIKGRLIIRYFMEVRHAPRWLQRATDAWLAILWIALLAIYVS
jgi:hypothetical protein